MNERVAGLRKQSVETKPYLSAERAELITRFYQTDVPVRESIPVTRARAFQYVAEHKTITIGDGELIVGEKGPAPKATPTYPELCCHSLSDLDILNSREKTPFAVNDQVRKVYQDTIIPFEVKYREGRAKSEDLRGLSLLCKERHIPRGYVITRDIADFDILTIPGKSHVEGGSQAEVQVLRIPAPLACCWLSQSEVS